MERNDEEMEREKMGCYREGKKKKNENMDDEGKKHNEERIKSWESSIHERMIKK